MMVAKIVQNKGGKSCPMCWALLLQGHMLCKGGIAGILLRKTKEENPLLLQRQSHFPSENKGGKSSAPAKAVAFSFGKQRRIYENHNETNHNNSSVTGNLYCEPVL
jgi:hypothetical protein